MLTPSQKGGIAEMAIAAEAVKLGIPVSRPMIEGGRYDLVLDLGSRLVRVQCKWAVRHGERIDVRICTSRRVRDGFLKTTYSPDEVGAIAAYCAALDRSYLF